MEDNKFEKHMEFLKKSYERIPSSFDSEEVLRKIEGETVNPREFETPSKMKSGFRRRFSVWAVSIASVFLFGFFTASFMFEQKNQPEEMTGMEVPDEGEYSVLPEVVHEYDEYIDSLKMEYEIEREKRRKVLKLDKEKFEKLEFIRYADSMISLVENKNYRESIMSVTNGKERLKGNFENAVSELKLPSEMAEDIKMAPLVDDEEGSIAFLSSYRSKVKSLIAVYDEILEENSDAVEQLQNSIEAMQEQSIQLYTNSDTDESAIRYYDSSLHKEIKNEFHPNTAGYIDMIVREPYTIGSSFRYSVQELVPMLQKMERTLVNVEKDFDLYSIMESYYVTIFNNIMVGAKSTKEFSEQGEIHEEYRGPLRELASGGTGPLTYILQPIIKELEASDWRQSKSLDSLDYNDLIDALELARVGGL